MYFTNKYRAQEEKHLITCILCILTDEMVNSVMNQRAYVYYV